MAPEHDEFNWARLLREIRRHQVVPVVGPELLPYYQRLAPALAGALQVPPRDHWSDVSAVADIHIERGGSLQRAADALDELLQQERDAALDWIDQLTQVRELRLFLTTDYDSLIERSLAGRGEVATTLAFAPQCQLDDVSDYPKTGRSVYHLFGHFERLGRVALAKVDQLEYLYRMQTAAGPTDLFDVLRERKNILFLGCDFPEWLTGFFTRILVGNPLYDTRERGMEVIANRLALEPGAPSSVTAFLRANHVEVYGGDARQFIAELARRYEAAAGAGARTSASQPHAGEPQPSWHAPPKGHVFVSYWRSDRAAVDVLIERLRKERIEVWFDEHDIPPGAQFEEDIRLAIQEDAAAFIAVVSSRALETERSYFVREWRWAQQAQEARLNDRRFVFPVLIDDGDKNAIVDPLRRAFAPFAALNIAQCPGGRLSEDGLVHELREARKRFERIRRGTA